MKKRNLIYALAIMGLLSSCAPSTYYYYQVYKAAPIGNLTVKEESIVYADTNCEVSYNLWREGGNIGFTFYNKTNENIYLNLGECFYILNGVAYDYYRNRVITNSVNAGISTSSTEVASKSVTGYNYYDLIQTNSLSATSTLGMVTSKGNSVAWVEDKIICIPSMTKKYVSEYLINRSLFRDCDLFIYPTKKQIITKKFTSSDSPYVFSNRLVYSVGNSEKSIKFENLFYINEIMNCSEDEMFEYNYDEFCGQKSSFKKRYFKSSLPNLFYIKYTKEQDYWKH